MTTAARPTFDPAKGKDNKNPTGQTSARDIASHTKLKYRKEGQEEFEELDENDFKNRLLAAEREHFNKIKAVETTEAAYSHRELTHEQQLLLQAVEEGKLPSDDEQVSEASKLKSISGIHDVETDDDEDDDEEDTEALMLELAKIKQERAEAKERQDRERAELEKQQEQEVLRGNPLLNDPDSQNFTVKRRWDDDVIFKNQARGMDDKPKKRFINDMLRSDFHQKFMDKYIR